MAKTLTDLSTVFFIVAAVGLVLAVFLWVFFNIPKVIGDLSGKTAKRSVAKIRAANEQSGYKSYRPSEANVLRGKLTEPVPEEEKRKRMRSAQAKGYYSKGTGDMTEGKSTSHLSDAPNMPGVSASVKSGSVAAASAAVGETEKISTTTELPSAKINEETEALSQGEETAALDLSIDLNEETQALNRDSTEETAILDRCDDPASTGRKYRVVGTGKIKLRIVEEIMLIQTDEVIG